MRLGVRQARRLASLVIALAIALAGGRGAIGTLGAAPDAPAQAVTAPGTAQLPACDGSPSIAVEADATHPDGAPDFTDEQVQEARGGSFERYSPLDSLGRCGPAMACLGPETMPTGARGDISGIHPSGWNQRLYDFVDQRALYNRSHLIAHSLSAEDANERNLVTGTRTMNEKGMRPWEERTARYIERTGNHVLYRSTPVFEGNELVCRGVRIEALSVEDDGEGLSFDVWCPNVEPGVTIDYATGDSHESGRPSDGSR